MKAVVFHGIGNISLDDVSEPRIEQPTDAILKITASSICGTDLHMVRGTMSGMKKGTVLGHEAVGIVEAIGEAVKHFKPGDRVVVCSTIACGTCAFCQAGEFASCDKSNLHGAEAGTPFFGGPEACGAFNGLQAERARIPYADTVLIALPDDLSDSDALLCSDIFPTGFMGAEMANVRAGDYVAVFGCGPVGQMAIASAKILGAKTVFAIDVLADRLEQAEKQGAVTINYETEDPVQALKSQTNGFGPDACIDAVGIDAQAPHAGPAKISPLESAGNFVQQKQNAPNTVLFGDQWNPGSAPFQVLSWCVESVRKSGVVSIIGVYPQTATFFPLGMVMQKALTVRAANCSHRKYIPKVLQLIKETSFHPSAILSKEEELHNVIDCYKHFDKREPGWLKVKLLA